MRSNTKGCLPAHSCALENQEQREGGEAVYKQKRNVKWDCERKWKRDLTSFEWRCWFLATGGPTPLVCTGDQGATLSKKGPARLHRTPNGSKNPCRARGTGVFRWAVRPLQEAKVLAIGKQPSNGGTCLALTVSLVANWPTALYRAGTREERLGLAPVCHKLYSKCNTLQENLNGNSPSLDLVASYI